MNAFERTGCLITMLPSDQHDSKIKPQGMKPGSFNVPSAAQEYEGDDQGSNGSQEEEGQSAEEAALEEERRSMEEQEEEEEEEEELLFE